MNGSGCKSCAIYPNCTAQYRGSTCAAIRSEYGLGDPMTNADRIRAMSDEELAKWMAERYANQKNVEAEQRGETLTATQISEAYQTCYCILRRWLKQPVKEDA